MFHVPTSTRNGERPRSCTDSGEDVTTRGHAPSPPTNLCQSASPQAQEDANGSIAVATPVAPAEPIHWKKSITKHMVTCLECRASFKQLSVRHLKEHALDGRSYRVKYGIPRTQALAAKETTLQRKEIVQRSRPWEKAPTFMKAQEKAQKAVAQRKRTAQRKGTARRKPRERGVAFHLLPTRPSSYMPLGIRRSVVAMNQPQQRKEGPKRQVLHPSCLWYIPPVLPHHSLTVVAD